MELVKIETEQDYHDFQDFLNDPEVKVLEKIEGKVATIYTLNTNQQVTVPKALTSPKKNYLIVLTDEDMCNATSHILKHEVLSYDSEATGLNVRKDEIIGVSFSGREGQGFYIPTYEWCPARGELDEIPKGKERAKKVINLLKNKKLIMWNGSYDIRITKNRYGVDLTEALWVEGMLLKHTLEEEGPFGLKESAIQIKDKIGFGGEEQANEEQIKMKESVKQNGGNTKKNNFEMYKADMEILGVYGASDADLTLRVVSYYLKKLKEENLEKFFFEDEVMPLYKYVTIPMETRGVKLDIPLLEQSKKEIQEDIELLETRVLDELSTYEEYYHWYRKVVGEVCEAKASGNFSQAYVQYFDLPLPKSDVTGKYQLGKKVVSTLKDDHHRSFLLKETATLEPEDEFAIKERIYLAKVEGKPLNIYSKKQMGELVFDFFKVKPIGKTKGGSPQFDDDFVEHLANNEGYPWAETLRDYNKLIKIKGSYIDRFLEGHEEGYYYFRYKQHGTISGRYSSDAQQLSKPDEEGKFSTIVSNHLNRIRKYFISEEGRIFIDSDYESLEPHVFAHVSGDEGLRSIFRNGHDFYSTIAIQTEGLEGVSADKKADNFLGKVDKSKRNDAKTYCLGVPYGMTGYALAKTLDIPVEEGERLVEGYLNGFPELKNWIDRSIKQAQTHGFVFSEAGRVRHLPKVKELHAPYGDKLLNYKFRNYLSQRLGHDYVLGIYRDYKNGKNNCVNFQIQSLAGSIVNRASIAISKEFKKRGIDAWVCANIHDQLILNVPRNKAEECLRIVEDRMKNSTKLSLELKCPPQLAANWYEGH